MAIPYLPSQYEKGGKKKFIGCGSYIGGDCGSSRYIIYLDY